MRPPTVAEISQYVALSEDVVLAEVMTHESVSATPVRLVMELHDNDKAVEARANGASDNEQRIIVRDAEGLGTHRKLFPTL
jgi:hypothetical protein